MWIFTQVGFFSITQADRSDRIQIRARRKTDLEQLAELCQVLDRTPIIETPAADYRWRMVVARWRWEMTAKKLAEGIDYRNFKGRIASTPRQADKITMLHAIWSMHQNYQQQATPKDPYAGHPSLFDQDDDLIGETTSWLDRNQAAAEPKPSKPASKPNRRKK